MGDRISLLVQTASAIIVSFGIGMSISWKLALVVISIQPVIIGCFYIKKVLLTGFAQQTAKAQQQAAQVASEAVAQHRTVTAFSAQDKVNFCQITVVGSIDDVRHIYITLGNPNGKNYQSGRTGTVHVVRMEFKCLIYKFQFDSCSLTFVPSMLLQVLGLFDAKLEGPKKEAFKRAQVAGVGLGAATFFLYASWGLDYWYGGKLASAGEVTFADVLKTFFVLVSTGRVLAEAGTLTPDLAKGTTAIASVFNILDRHTEIDAESKNSEKVDNVEGHVELRDVQFAYPARPDVMIFKNFNLTVKAGCTVAMVGQSGSGKSTIIGLIERFYDPLKGTVLIDGKDIKIMNLQSLRQHIGLVSQEPTLFAGTLRDNIAYGRADASESDIIEAAVAANAHMFIRSDFEFPFHVTPAKSFLFPQLRP